ncbi:DUF6850 family outer membrane beta-barrel protein [uncultured Bacteroides sp.]|uniref:DUF6850 family outer membrane beta-barrel protein n=1 Tax=uncultured Bacteroides sp. TaxID=162156 RepID=UPI0025D6174F|nr:DUF6850 family outer membrane beta-barrel protein [uncultured Bacteroides sp.]
MSNMKELYIGCMLLGISAMSWAQTYDVIERRNSWNAGTNVTGIRTDSVSVSYAELYGQNHHGDFRNSSEAGKLWSAGAVAKSITHMKNYSLVGAFSFDHTSGKDMSGSMFIHPGFYPVDILEFTPGRKDLQTYAFMGGIAADANANWRVGGTIDFAAANYSKRKDLRHTNYRLDLKVAPSIMYHTGDFAIGLSYIFSKNSESIKAEEIGTAATSYYAFLDKGLMYGAYETWSGSGIHLSESGINGFPIKELSHGVAMQAQWRELYGDMEYRHSSGSAGEREAIWFEFPTERITSHLRYQWKRGGTEHFIRLNLLWSHQTNNENILGQETSNGITTTRVYGSNRIFERNVFAANPEYEVMSPKGEFTVGVNLSTVKSLSTQMFPYIVSQTLFRGGAYASGVLHVGAFDVKATAGFSKGNYTEKSRTAETGATEPGEAPYRLADYYNLQNEYATAARATLVLGLRYNFGKGMYAEIEGSYTHGFKLTYIEGASRWNEALKLGYAF